MRVHTLSIAFVITLAAQTSSADVARATIIETSGTTSKASIAIDAAPAEVDEGRRTRIDATLYMDVVGVVSVFVSDKKIRSMRQAKLRADLEDVARWFRLQRRSASQ